ncbi:MAG: FkbM family methyltransferase [Verrucomicrobiaceae bacterium]|nr:FkbM family methyltransferase [Verrucomicrobiaceae bacterium]
MAWTFKSLVPDALKWKLRKWIWLRLNPSWTLRSGIVIRVLNYNDWMIYNDIFVDGEYDPPLEQLLDATAKRSDPAHVLDLGANVGFFTLRLADTFLRRGRHDFEIVQVEGAPSNFAELRERLQANEPLLGKRVRSVHGLAGERTGEARIAENPSHGENTIMMPPRGAKSVSFVDIEELVRPWERVDLLKCDIEGAEELLLRNYPGLLRKTDSAVFEFHHDQCDIAYCRQRLRECGLTNARTLREFGRCSVEFFSRR